MNGLAKIWRRGVGLVRFARNIRGFLADPISVEQAAHRVSQGVLERETRFLAKLECAVYANPRSPYLQLLAHCGCEFGDAKALVESEGLDSALLRLAQQGVYLTFAEFKCRTPVTRGSRTFHFQPEDFADTTFRAESTARTSGSSGAPMRFGWSFALTGQWAPHWCVFFAAHGAIGDPLILWWPGNAGAIGPQLSWAKFGQRLDHWFVAQEMTHLPDRAYTEAKHWICRRFAGFPKSRNAAYHDTKPVLDCLGEILARTQRATLNTTPTAAVRLSLAAQEQKLTLTGLRCFLGGEPLTQARRETIEASGARAAPLYGSTEAVWTGGQCPFPGQADEVHVLRDLHAVIPSPHEEQSPEETPLLFTSLAPATSLITLNCDIGDRGVVVQRNCDCLYHEIGCRQTIRNIRSSDKLTELGVTIWVSDVHDVLENALSQRYAAAPGDFQLVEARTPAGLPRYLLLVHPRVEGVVESAVASLFLAELGRRKSYYSFMTAIWHREGVLSVHRHRPLQSSRGKALPFQRLRDPALLPDPLREFVTAG